MSRKARKRRGKARKTPRAGRLARAASARGRRGLFALVLLFVASGATSLVYENLWARQLHLVFGTSQVAISTVLAAFMAGLAVGSLGAARWAARVRRPLAAYAMLEAFIGLYALVFPLLLGLMQALYLAFFRAVDPSPLAFATFQLLLVGAWRSCLRRSAWELHCRFSRDSSVPSGTRSGGGSAVSTVRIRSAQ